jgi:hypothetical protein
VDAGSDCRAGIDEGGGVNHDVREEGLFDDTSLAKAMIGPA